MNARGPSRTSAAQVVAARCAVAVAAVLATALVADLLVPPASADLSRTVYVDRRIGSDDFDGRTPERALASLDEALSRARPGADILLTGYGDRLVYRGTGTRCVDLVGTPERPITIRRNVYTNTLHPVVLTTRSRVRAGWRRDRRDGFLTTWSTPWPGRIVLTGDPDEGFVTVGEVSIPGYATAPGPEVGSAAWWARGRLHVRLPRYDPDAYPVTVKAGDGICLSERSRHVRVSDLSVHGAIHAVRVEPGARDVAVQHLVRYNVLDDDVRPRPTRPAPRRRAR